jgi:hypothetical protein
MMASPYGDTVAVPHIGGVTISTEVGSIWCDPGVSLVKTYTVTGYVIDVIAASSTASGGVGWAMAKSAQVSQINTAERIVVREGVKVGLLI